MCWRKPCGKYTELIFSNGKLFEQSATKGAPEIDDLESLEPSFVNDDAKDAGKLKTFEIKFKNNEEIVSKIEDSLEKVGSLTLG